MFNTHPPVTRHRIGKGGTLLCFSLLLSLSLYGHALPADSPAAESTIRSLGDFWNAESQPHEVEWVHPLDLVVDVLYYDAEWNVLWVRGAEGNGSFFPARENHPLPLESNQQVRLRGTIIPSEGLDPARITVERLRSDILAHENPAPISPADPGARHLTWTGVMGFVDRQTTNGDGHAALDLIIDGHRILVHILKAPDEPMPYYTGEFIRVTGVFTANSNDDESGGMALWVPNQRWVRADEKYGAGLLAKPSQMISEIAALPENRITRISGMVFTHEPGQELIVRDETGQVIIQTPQLSRVSSGDLVDVFGYPDSRSYPPTLRFAIYRRVSSFAQAARPRDAANRNEELLTRIRLVRQVLRMDRIALEARPMAKLVGTVTYISHERDFLYLHDSSGGIRVEFDSPIHPSIKPGILLDVGGRAEPGNVAPQVRSVSNNSLGNANMPIPRKVSLEQATSGMETGQWVRLEGYLRDSRAIDKNHVMLSLVTANGDFEALVQAPEITLVQGASLAITGVCSLDVGPGQQVPSVRLLVSDESQIAVQAPALAQPFSLPLTTIEHLQNYRPIAALHRPMKTQGVVTHHVPGRALWISDGDHVLHALSEDTDPKPLLPGQLVEVVGLPGRLGPQFVLREAHFRTIEAPPTPPAVLQLATSQVDPVLHGRLVRQVGELVNVANTGLSWILFIRAQNNVIPVKLAPETKPHDDARPPSFDPAKQFNLGSTLAVEGLYQVVRDESGLPISFEIMARSPADITLVRAPPWWNAERAQQAAIVLLLLALGGAGWLLAQQRRFARQRKLIQQQIAEESYQRRHYQDLVDQATEFIFTLDLEGNFTSFNKSGERMTGLTREQALTKKIYDIIDAKAARRTRIYIKRRLNHTKAVTFEYQLLRTDGTTLDVETSAGFIHRDGEIVGGYGIMRDISRRKQDEAERRAFEARVQQSKKLEGLGTLASGIAHDFNNILASISGAVDVSRLEKSEDQRQELFDQIGVSAERAKQLVRQILAFSRNHASERQPLDLRDAAKEVYTMVRTSRPATVDLQLQVPEQPLVVRANATEIHQVIMNIVTNACHALPDQRGHVAILLDPCEITPSNTADVDAITPGRYARMRIRDDGSGMTPAVLDRIFDPFFTTKRNGEGTGLGLAAAHGIVQSNGGGIRVETEPNQGTQFTIFLPLSDEPVPVPPDKKINTPTLGSGQSILLVDDDRMVGLILEKTLRKLNYTPVRFTDPIDAKAYFDEAPDRIDAVLSDLSMPELTGRDLAEHMLTVRPDLPFVIQSGHIQENLEKDLLALGVRHVFGKPVPIKPLATALAEIFGHRTD